MKKSKYASKNERTNKDKSEHLGKVEGNNKRMKALKSKLLKEDMKKSKTTDTHTGKRFRM